MRRRLIIAVLTLLLGLGGLVGTASPAAAHHTHNPWTICRDLERQWGASYYDVIGAQTVEWDWTGHPTRARCAIRSTTTFNTYCRKIYYYSHGVNYC